MINIKVYIVLFLFPISLSAQRLIIDGMQEKGNTAARVNDLNGNPCAVVNVYAIGLSNLSFKGTHTIKIDTTNNVYVLNIPGGEKFLYIQHKDYEELKVSFLDFGYKTLKPDKIYNIMLRGTNSKITDLTSNKVSTTTYAEKTRICILGSRQLIRKKYKEAYSVKGVPFSMIYVEGGTYELGIDDNSFFYPLPTMKVSMSGFYIGQTEVTQELWEAVMGYLPSIDYKESKAPVYNVSWNECQEFIKRLNALTSMNFRLPTEEEWEYAAMGGTLSQRYVFSGSSRLSDVGWYDDNSNGHPHIVATKNPNEIGLYDMSGNVGEWCSPARGNRTPSSGGISRGGDFSSIEQLCLNKSAADWSFLNHRGLRLLLP